MNLRRSLLPDMTLFQTFECAARHANFSRAAEELNLTQSAVSRQIAELEGQTGQALFERIRKRVVLSLAGARLLPEVRHLLAEAERVMIGTLAASPTRIGLRVGTLPTIGARWLVPRLGGFLQRHPEVDLTLETRDRPFSFVEETLDLAIHYGQPVWPGAVATFLCKESMLPVASRDLAAALGTVGPADLARAPLVHQTTRPRLWSQWFDLHGVSDAGTWGGLRFDTFAMVISAVTAGLGVALLPSYLIEAETRSGALVALTGSAMPTDKSYYIVRPEGRHANSAVLDFQTWLLEQPGR